ncbi:MAG: hypothetical protein ACU85E_03270 [Gammaproteobacteria bacterium]
MNLTGEKFDESGKIRMVSITCIYQDYRQLRKILKEVLIKIIPSAEPGCMAKYGFCFGNSIVQDFEKRQLAATSLIVSN